MIHDREIKILPNGGPTSNSLQWIHIECLEHFAFEQVRKKQIIIYALKLLFYNLSLKVFQMS